MKSSNWLLIALAALAMACSPVLAKEGNGDKPEAKKEVKKDGEKKEGAKKDGAKKEGDKAKGGLRGEQAQMVEQAKLSPEQVKQLEEKVQAKQTALEEWKKTNADKMTELKNQIKEAGADKEKVKALKDQMAAIEAQKAEIEKKYDADVDSILTAEQKVAWNGFKLYRTTMGKYAKAKLTADQEAKIREMAAAAAKDMPAQGKEKEEAMGKFYKSVEEQVLTPEQREMFQKPAKKGGEKAEGDKAKAEKAEKAEKGAKKGDKAEKADKAE